MRKDETIVAKTSPKGSGDEVPTVVEDEEADDDDLPTEEDLPSTKIHINFAAVDARIDIEPRAWQRAFSAVFGRGHPPLVLTLPEIRAKATFDVSLELS